MQSSTAEIEAECSTEDLPQKSVGKVRLLSLDRLDGRTIAARRAKELIEAIETDRGGSDRLSEGTKQLIQRAAVLGTYIESCEAQWLAGQPVALADYLAAIGVQRRVLTTIGLQRVPRTIEPELDAYITSPASQSETLPAPKVSTIGETTTQPAEAEPESAT